MLQTVRATDWCLDSHRISFYRPRNSQTMIPEKMTTAVIYKLSWVKHTQLNSICKRPLTWQLSINSTVIWLAWHFWQCVYVCLCCSVCQLAGLTVCLLAVVAASYTLRARPPRIGFLAMRGKRNASSPERHSGGPLVTRPRRFTYPLHRLIRLDDLYKDLYTRADRTPFGFTGLRGKKTPSGFAGLRGKRIPNGFGGLRGKKIPSGFSGLRGRRIPNGFSGLRGKKIPNGFSGLRGKRPRDGAVGFGRTEPGEERMSPERQLATRLLDLSDLPSLDALTQMEEHAGPSRQPLEQLDHDWLQEEEEWRHQPVGGRREADRSGGCYIRLHVSFQTPVGEQTTIAAAGTAAVTSAHHRDDVIRHCLTSPRHAVMSGLINDVVHFLLRFKIAFTWRNAERAFGYWQVSDFPYRWRGWFLWKSGRVISRLLLFLLVLKTTD